MSKKNRSSNRNNNVVEFVPLNIPKEGTILERFRLYISKHKKKSDIINFLSVVNAELIGLGGMEKISTEKANEILEFADYFNENFYDIMFDDMMDNWGQDPFVLRLADEIEDELYVQARNEYLSTLPEFIKTEAETLCDTLFSIRENKRLTFVFNDEDGYETEYVEIPKSIPKQQLKDFKDNLLLGCVFCIEGYGAITVRLFKKDHEEIFGIRILPNGIWSPISKEEMREASLTTPDGIELEPEEGVVYTEIQRTKF